MEIPLHHVHHWPNLKQRIMVCFSLLWVGLIWIADVKIPQDVLKMISGHVVTKKWHVENAVSTPILFQRIFLENSHNNKMSYKYLHFIQICIFPFIQSCTRFWSAPSLSSSIRSLSPLSFACLSFAWTYLLVFSLSIVHILPSKTHQKQHLECNYLN